MKDDKRFGGRFKDRPFTASTDLSAVDCGACQRGAAWKDRKGSTWTPAPKAARSRAAATSAEAGK